MKSWIKHTIRTSTHGYLTLQIAHKLRILPFHYVYQSGRLISRLYIIQAEEIEALRHHHTHAITISKENFVINLLGTIRIFDRDLDHDWAEQKQINQPTIHPEDESEISQYDIVQLKKQVGIEFIPSKVTASNGTERVEYEMEILP